MVKIRERKKKKSKEALQKEVKDVVRFVNNNFNYGKNTQSQ